MIRQLIDGSFAGKDILSLSQFSKEDILTVIQEAQNLKPSTILSGNLVALIFYEPSSRTFGSFDAAVKRLGGQTLNIINPQQFSSVVKGETLEDTVRVFESYTDAIVIRHPEKGAAQKAARACERVPVINAGDGIGEHPTQALLDLYTIYQHFGRLDNLTLVFAGDMLNGRTVHSLLKGLSLFEGITAYLLSPTQLKLDRELFNEINKDVKLHEIENEKDIPKNAHVWYWTRVQKERFSNLEEYEKVKNSFIVTKKMLETYGNKDTILMHPLPRVGEILEEVDSDPRAVYLREQMRNGMYVRMAILAMVLGKHA